jgi:hypothetical protein
MSDGDDTQIGRPRLATPPALDHFPVEEFVCHDGTPYPEEWIPTRLAKLKFVLERFRTMWATTAVRNPAIIVVCGYRSPPYNQQLRQRSTGVAEHSQHPEGTAADVRPVDLRNLPEFLRVFEGMVKNGQLDEVGGYGFYPGWLHLDVRDKPADGHVAFWFGSGFGSDR